MNTFDFACRLDDLILGCLRGGNTPEELQQVMKETIEHLFDKENPEGLVFLSKSTK